MCSGGKTSSPAPIAAPPAPEPVKEPNRAFVANRRNRYKAAGLPGTNVTGGLGVTGAATTTKTLLGV